MFTTNVCNTHSKTLLIDTIIDVLQIYIMYVGFARVILFFFYMALGFALYGNVNILKQVTAIEPLSTKWRCNVLEEVKPSSS